MASRTETRRAVGAAAWCPSTAAAGARARRLRRQRYGRPGRPAKHLARLARQARARTASCSSIRLRLSSVVLSALVTYLVGAPRRTRFPEYESHDDSGKRFDNGSIRSQNAREPAVANGFVSRQSQQRHSSSYARRASAWASRRRSLSPLTQPRLRECIGDGPRIRRQPRWRSDRQALARPGSVRRADRDVSKGAANPAVRRGSRDAAGGATPDATRAWLLLAEPGRELWSDGVTASLRRRTAAPAGSEKQRNRPSRSSGRELVVQEQRHLGVGDAGDRPERVAGAGGEGVAVRRR